MAKADGKVTMDRWYDEREVPDRDQMAGRTYLFDGEVVDGGTLWDENDVSVLVDLYDLDVGEAVTLGMCDEVQRLT